MSQTPSIHIGYPKAASKTLQEGLFAGHSQIEVIGKPYADDRIPRWLTNIHMLDTIEFDMDKCRRGYDQHVVPRLAGNKALVVSFELFTLPQHADRGVIAERLRALFGEARIIVNIRSQLDQLVSMYRFQYARATHSQSIREYIESGSNNYVGGRVFHLDYDKLIACYTHLFGRQNVGVFLFEDLVRDPESYAGKICAFIGVDGEEGARCLSGVHENPARSVALTRYTRLRKLMLPRIELRRHLPQALHRRFRTLLTRGPKLKVTIPEDLVAPLEDRFREGNRRLADEFELPLGDAGYPV